MSEDTSLRVNPWYMIGLFRVGGDGVQKAEPFKMLKPFRFSERDNKFLKEQAEAIEKAHIIVSQCVNHSQWITVGIYDHNGNKLRAVPARGAGCLLHRMRRATPCEIREEERRRKALADAASGKSEDAVSNLDPWGQR